MSTLGLLLLIPLALVAIPVALLLGVIALAVAVGALFFSLPFLLVAVITGNMTIWYVGLGIGAVLTLLGGGSNG